jgi:hypothetical protein
MANTFLSNVRSRPLSQQGRDNFDNIFPNSKKDWDVERETNQKEDGHDKVRI